MTRALYPVQIYTADSGWTKQFAIFSPEYNAISAGIIGMKINEQKRISIPSGNSMTQTWSTDQLMLNQVNISDISIGDVLAMGVSDNPEGEVISLSNYVCPQPGKPLKRLSRGCCRLWLSLC